MSAVGVVGVVVLGFVVGEVVLTVVGKLERFSLKL